MRGKSTGLALLLLAAAVGPAWGQATHLIATESERFQPPVLCNLRTSGRVNDGLRALRTGIEHEDGARRMESLKSALAFLTEAAAAGEDPAAWYYLGRTYLALGDVAGADTAFTRASALLESQPTCGLDMDQRRQNAWALLANAGIDKLRENDLDSALVILLQAHTLFRDLPHVAENIGVLFANKGQNDSAIAYFALAAEVSEQDTSLVDNRNSAQMNLAYTLQRADRHQEAIRVLDQFLVWNPGDLDAQKSLAFSLRQAGQGERADSLEQAMVAVFSEMNFDSLSTADLMSVGVGMFNADQFQQAAEVFDLLRQRNPWNRDAVYNLTNAYLALEQWDKLVEVGRRLLEIEPLSEDAYRLVGQAWRALEQTDSLLRVAEMLVTMPVALDVTSFGLNPSGARFAATARGRAATDRSGQETPPAPITVVVEFVTDAGAVVASQEVDVPALPVDETHPIRVEAQGEGITAWRYRRK